MENNKINEQQYFQKLSPEEKAWVKSKPFGKQEESSRRIKDFAFILELIDLPVSISASRGGPSSSKILDLGAGSAWTSIWLAKMGYEVTATDISADILKVGQDEAKRLELTNITFKTIDSEKLEFENEFDGAIVYDTLHHTKDEQAVIKGILQALKPGGRILIVEPNSSHGWDREAQAIAKKYGVLERGFSPKYLSQVLKSNGFIDIVRWHAGGQVVRAYSNKFKDSIKSVAVPIAARLIYGRYKSPVWLTAQKRS